MDYYLNYDSVLTYKGSLKMVYSSAFQDSETPEYWINGAPVSKEEYDAAVAERNTHKNIEVGRSYSASSTDPIDSYEVIRDKHLQFIIDVNIFALDEHLVQVALDNEIAKGFSLNTVRKYKNVLLRIFEAYRPEFKPNLVVRK